jgi:hypothetical protein
MLRRPRRRDDDDGDDDNAAEPPGGWSRFAAELAPQAVSDLLAMDESRTKAAIIRLLEGCDPVEVMADLAVSIQPLPDSIGGWSVLRVSGWVIPYKPLTRAQCTQLGRNADILVSRIVPIAEYYRLVAQP